MEIDDGEDSQEETTISDEESDGLDEESEPDSDDLMDSTDNSATESPMKSGKNSFSDFRATVILAESSKADADDNMSDESEDPQIANAADKESQETVNTQDVPQKEISFNLDTSSEADNPDNSSL